jgi:quinol monooxygenase YgiN
MAEQVGFVVIYRWRLHAHLVEQFKTVWARNTPLIRERCGGLGSRLHEAEDGTWLAYAQWPDQLSWEKSYSHNDWDPEGSALFRAAIAESFPPLLLHPQIDLLVKADVVERG